MSELAIPTRQHADLQAYQDTNLARLEAWAHQAIAVREMADVIANTSMCPQAYRGKPDEATAAILAGAEVGLSPMASLRAFDNIQGTPAPKAITLRAVVQGLGHTVEIVRSTHLEAVVRGRRRGETEWQTSTWTIERAQTMGLAGKAQWKQQPAAMLVARATSEVCRWIAADAIMGMPYAAEEIPDHAGLQATPVTTRVTAADIVGLAVDHAAAEPPAEAVAAPARPATVDSIDAPEALSRIRHATSQDDLDRIKQMCRASGLYDPDVLAAWTQRSEEFAAPVVDPDEEWPPVAQPQGGEPA